VNIKEVEKAILNLILTDENCLLKGMDKLTEDSFVTKPSSKIFFIFFTLFMSGSNVSYLTATSKTHAGFLEYLNEISETEANPRDFEDLIDILEDTKTKKNCVMFANRILQDATDEVSGKDMLEYISDGSLELLSGPEGDIVDISEVFEERYSEENMKKAKDRGFQTSLPSLDKIITGFRKGSLTVICGKTSTGKSELARQICYYNAVRGIPSLTFTLEETPQECLDKITALATGLNHWKITNDYLDKGDHKVIKDSGVNDLPLLFMDDSTPSLAALFAKARKTKHLLGKDFLIIVDHLQFLSKDSTEPEISKVTKGLKLMARKLKLPIIALSQLNRDADRRDGNLPLLSDLRGSGSIEQDSNTIIYIQLEEVARPDPNKKKTLLWVLKNRGGSTGLVKTINYTPIQKFVESAKEEGGTHDTLIL
jgi:replicative DNA helicase